MWCWPYLLYGVQCLILGYLKVEKIVIHLWWICTDYIVATSNSNTKPHSTQGKQIVKEVFPKGFWCLNNCIWLWFKRSGLKYLKTVVISSIFMKYNSFQCNFSKNCLFYVTKLMDVYKSGETNILHCSL